LATLIFRSTPIQTTSGCDHEGSINSVALVITDGRRLLQPLQVSTQWYNDPLKIT